MADEQTSVSMLSALAHFAVLAEPLKPAAVQTSWLHLRPRADVQMCSPARAAPPVHCLLGFLRQ